MTDILTDLRSDEGWTPHAYRDHLGFWTLGYGFLIDERRGGRIPKPVAEFWLKYEVNEREAQLKALWPGYEKQPADVKRALLNMAYQLGPAGVSKFKNMLAALELGDRPAAARHALDSTWADQTPARAQRVAALIRGKS